MGYKKVNVILDRGFYSKSNINALYKAHQKFIVGTKLSLTYVKKVLDTERTNLQSYSNYHTQYGVYAVCKSIDWNYEQERPYKGDVLREKRRAYLHLYFNPEKAARDIAQTNDYMNSLRNDLEQKSTKEYRSKDYEKYFTIHETPKRGRRIVPNEKAIEARIRNHGYFALLTNEVKDPMVALSLYRSKDMAEKSFGDLKERLQFRRMHVSSELSLDGKFFVEFVALIYLSYIKKAMQDVGLFDKWTLQNLLDELDSIELFEAPGHGRILGEVTSKQVALFEGLCVGVPR
jgi:transposase